MSTSMRWPTVVDLFCGCGGVTSGFKRRGFRVVAAVDNDDDACATYRLNHPTVDLYEGDIADINPSKIRRRNLARRNLDVLAVCAPCQPFSSQTRNAKRDKRSRLILEAIRFAEVLKPRIIFFENVPGLARSRFSKLMGELHRGLEELDYKLGEPQRIDAADYGVPQRRIRCIVLARKKSAPPELPKPTTPVGHRMTVRDAIGDLCALSSGQADSNDDLHYARTHQPQALERFAAIPKNGGSRKALPKSLQLTCHAENRGYPDVYGRMAWDDVAPTLTGGCTDATRGRFVHPRDDRAITLREAARLQTFPDHYAFEGCTGRIALQVGNAVPPELVAALAPTIRGGLSG